MSSSHALLKSRESNDGMHEVWLLFVGSGLLMAVLGAILIAFSVYTTKAIVLLFGCMLVVAAVIQLANSCWARRWKGFTVSIFLGILYLTMGFVLIEHLMQTAVAGTLVVAAGLMIAGLVRIILSPLERWVGWQLSLCSGVLSLILGIGIWREWPFSGLWVIGFFVGLEMIMNGLVWIKLGTSVRHLHPAVSQNNDK